eukprot:1182305-Prorocentrum_minimum.AAC.2
MAQALQDPSHLNELAARRRTMKNTEDTEEQKMTSTVMILKPASVTSLVGPSPGLGLRFYPTLGNAVRKTANTMLIRRNYGYNTSSRIPSTDDLRLPAACIFDPDSLFVAGERYVRIYDSDSECWTQRWRFTALETDMEVANYVTPSEHLVVALVPPKIIE